MYLINAITRRGSPLDGNVLFLINEYLGLMVSIFSTCYYYICSSYSIKHYSLRIITIYLFKFRKKSKTLKKMVGAIDGVAILHFWYFRLIL